MNSKYRVINRLSFFVRELYINKASSMDSALSVRGIYINNASLIDCSFFVCKLNMKNASCFYESELYVIYILHAINRLCIEYM